MKLYIINKTKALYFDPAGFGEGRCFLDFACAREGSLLALSILLNVHPLEYFEGPLLGSWAYDQILVGPEDIRIGYGDITPELLKTVLQDEFIAHSIFEKAFRHEDEGVLNALKAAKIPILSSKKKWIEHKKKHIFRDFEGELKRLCWDLTQQAEGLGLNVEDTKNLSQSLQRNFLQLSRRVQKS